MIALIKSEEINNMLSQLRDIEERFWLNYRMYAKTDRQYIEDNFNKIYVLLDSIKGKDGVQEEMRFKDD